MHQSAMLNGKLFFETYCSNISNGLVLDIGSQDVNGSLKSVCPQQLRYVGVDFVAGKNVDVILSDPYKLPFEDNYADVIVSSSCFEHSELFWITFLEIMRVLKPTGVFYLSAPSNGPFHRYPVDCWRFYPDSGNALVKWGRLNGMPKLTLLESYTSRQDVGVAIDSCWNDFTAIFLKNGDNFCSYPKRITTTLTSADNSLILGNNTFTNYQFLPEDQRKLYTNTTALR